MQVVMDKKGQGQIMELTVTFFLVVTFAMGMSVYVRRAVQAKIHGAAHYTARSVGEVYADPSLNFVGNFYSQYEPYYQHAASLRERDSEVVDRILPVGRDGLMEKEIKREQARSTTESIQSPPVCGD